MTTGGTDGRDRPGDADRVDVGEEVARLSEALAGWWTSVTAGSPAESGAPGGPGTGGDHPDGRAQHHERHEHHAQQGPVGNSCRVCPVCRAIDLARAARPDLLEKVALAAETVALLLREATGNRSDGPADGPPAAENDETDETDETDPDLLRRGTPIVVTDGDVPIDRGRPAAGRTQRMGLTIGVDIGGTKIAAGVVDDGGTLVAGARRETPATDAQLIEDQVAEVVAELRTEHEIDAVGVAAAGFIDSARGVVLFAPNLAWRDEPIVDDLQRRLGLPVRLENDANAAGLGGVPVRRGPRGGRHGHGHGRHGARRRDRGRRPPAARRPRARR